MIGTNLDSGRLPTGETGREWRKEFSMNLAPGGLIAWIVVGLIAGWLASMVMRGGYGLVGDLIVGLIGAVIGGFVLGLLGVGGSAGFVGSIAVAFIGAVILIAIVRMFTRQRRFGL